MDRIMSSAHQNENMTDNETPNGADKPAAAVAAARQRGTGGQALQTFEAAEKFEVTT
jgi:hypothetical protein